MEELLLELLRAVLTPERVLLLGELALGVLLTMLCASVAVHYLTNALKPRLAAGRARSVLLTLLPLVLGAGVGTLGWLLVGWSLLLMVGLVTGLMHSVFYKIFTSLLQAAVARAVAELRSPG